MEYWIKTASGTLKISEPELYVDNASRKRSGHMSHAMVEYQPGKLLAFNSNCSAVRCNGHAAYGWIEYRRSEDYGEHWGEIQELPYAKQAFLDGLFTISVEKAVACEDGTIVAFAIRNSPLRPHSCEPWQTPMVLRSTDAGTTWEEAYELSPWCGRVYDVIYHEGCIYVLEFCNDAEIAFTGNKPEHVYRLFRSDDSGKSFLELSVVDIESMGRGYGSMLFRPDGSLALYAYNISKEDALEMSVSYDKGKSWIRCPPCRAAKKIRNPQTAILDGIYLLHGRAGGDLAGLVLYTSTDGLHWDDGTLIAEEKPCCYYSNNLVLRGKNGKSKMLMQYSDTYAAACVNVMHRWVEWVE